MRQFRCFVRISWLFILLSTPSLAIADVRLPSIISDNMVLQRGRLVPIWGEADPGEAVTVIVGNQQLETQADDKGQWQVDLAPLSADNPLKMTIKGKNTITITNILVGEAWVCSGQSNMPWPVIRSDNADAEIAAADYPQIRLFSMERISSKHPITDTPGRWVVCTPETVTRFSAVAYFFGRHLHQKLNIPIGLINSSWGGTPAEAWTTHQTLESNSDFTPILDHWEEAVLTYPKIKNRYTKRLEKWKEQVAEAKATTQPADQQLPRRPSEPFGAPGHRHTPAGLYNGMIHPIVPFAMRGAIWYQGEANAKRAYQYRTLFPAMIRDWREAWGQGDFPFLFVQLANYRERHDQPTESDWAELREAQLMTLQLPQTGMAVIIDIGEADDIHPTNKQDVGHRLAFAAESIAYGHDVVYSGPIYDFMTIEGNKARIRFKHVGSGLVTQNGNKLTGFAIAGRDRKFVWANAQIEGDTVIVWRDEIAKPVAVRYAWADNPACNLCNKEGLPASPFRTDPWPGKTFTAR